MKRVLPAVSFLAMLLFLAVGSLHAAPPAKVTISHPEVFKKLRKAPVPFNHEQHTKAVNGNCAECHHTYKGKGEPVACSKCHGKKKEGKKLSLMKAFHKNCMGCHKKMAKAGKPTGPARKCSGCHKK